MDEQLNNVIRAAVQAELLSNGDLVVITAGLPLQTSGTTNMLKVQTVADVCFTGQGIGKQKISGTVRIIKNKDDWADLPANADHSHHRYRRFDACLFDRGSRNHSRRARTDLSCS